MLIYVTKQFLYFLGILIVMSMFSFLLIYLVPGDPAIIMSGIMAPPEVIEDVRESLGLQRPFFERMASWYADLVLHGDLGESFFLRRKVFTAIVERLPVSLSLTSFALVIASVIGLPLGILAALKRNTWVDQVASTIATLGLSIPAFWLGLMLIRYFSVGLGWFPTGRYVAPTEDFFASLRSLFLPAFCLGFIISAQICRMTRSSLLEVIKSDYILTARSKGVRESTVIFRHALRNALIPIITVMGVLVAIAIGGGVVIETVFTLPGLGRLATKALLQRDYPVMQGLLLAISGIVVFVNTVVDVLYGYLDPRIVYD